MGLFDLAGKVVVITGGGRGIGEGIARCFADAGASVVVGARGEDDIERVAGAIRASGGSAHAVCTDVTDPFSLGRLAGAAIAEFGTLDVWVNNAGGSPTRKPLAEISQREWDTCIALNLTAVWNGAMAAAELIEQGSIINISSMSAYCGAPLSGHFAACKAAVNSLTQTMARELAPRIRVNGIAPGPVPTESMIAATLSSHDDLEELARRIPLGLGTPTDVGAAAVYLASQAGRWMTGQTIHLTGGQ
jgi:NAD(P)-dependent dehydrogenase (short-subunit alcohol dehydrogenase family)